MCDVLSANEGKLNDLDSGSGDADCGSTHKAGAEGIVNHLVSNDIYTHMVIMYIYRCNDIILYTMH